mmetsp:Transcript_53617/g.116884  ORF Transcript_53617/g.116884 Transcript_53617/m.116884 type:complete len:267 (-) Transcript_53617:588-1388(-)|eukprot:6184536-Pleurochrysis_carterae.AAC.1
MKSRDFVESKRCDSSQVEGASANISHACEVCLVPGNAPRFVNADAAADHVGGLRGAPAQCVPLGPGRTHQPTDFEVAVRRERIRSATARRRLLQPSEVEDRNLTPASLTANVNRLAAHGDFLLKKPLNWHKECALSGQLGFVRLEGLVGQFERRKGKVGSRGRPIVHLVVIPVRHPVLGDPVAACDARVGKKQTEADLDEVEVAARSRRLVAEKEHTVCHGPFPAHLSVRVVIEVVQAGGRHDVRAFRVQWKAGESLNRPTLQHAG